MATPGKIIEEGTGMTKTLYPLYAVFAYTSDAQKYERDRIKEHCSEKSWPGFRLVGVADKEICIFNDNKSDFENINFQKDEFIITFLSMLLTNLENIAKSRGDFDIKYWL